MISRRMGEKIKMGSAIRAAFNEAGRLRAQYGADAVFDLSLGNPGAPAPARVREEARRLLDDPALDHGYMSDAGYEGVREQVAGYLNRVYDAGCTREHVIMSVGAAGGINAVLCALLDRGDQVIVFRPYYPAYVNFIENWGGELVGIPPKGTDFQPDLEALKAAMTPRTKVVMVNSPHNPTGTIYTQETVQGIARILQGKEREYGHAIYLLSDEPYRELIYDGSRPVWWPHNYANTVVIYSFSKSLSLPGERIGYVTLSPALEEWKTVAQAVRLATGALGYVNAPAFFQRVVARCLDERVDLAYYERNRRTLYGALRELGFEAAEPRGAFYIWVKSPLERESDFLDRARRHNLIFVAGSAFAWEGYARLSFCGSHEMLVGARPALAALAEDCGLRAATRKEELR